MKTYSAGLYSDNIELKLDNIEKLCARLGNPQKKLEFIHIAGTNGKGSVCAYLESIFLEAGYRVGKFSSPDITDSHDSICVNRKNITDAELVSLHNKIADTGIYVSEFEALTVCAFLHFFNNGCDIVILEAGLGGEGDATNIIDTPKCSVITKISLDHTNYLGTTIEEIAQKKAGIIKYGGKTVTVTQNKSVIEIIEQKCIKEKNNLKISDTPEILSPEFVYESIKYKDALYYLSLGGLHQAENATLAIEVALGFNIPENIIKSGLKKANNPGRFELLSEKPIVIFDGAHNADGFEALLNSLARYFGDKKKSFIIGMMKDKDTEKIAELLKGVHCDVYTLTVPGNPRAMSSSELKSVFEKYGVVATDIECIENIKNVISDNINIICGSLYMYREVSKLFKNGQ